MKPNKNTNSCLLALAALATAPTSMASLLFQETNLATSEFSTGLEILNTGTVVRAYHFGGENINNVTVNGITFVAGGPTVVENEPKVFADSAMTGTWDGGWGSWGYEGEVLVWNGWQDAWPLNSIADTNYKQLVSAMVAFQHPTVETGISPSTITIGGLSIGQEYRLQLISNNPRGGVFDVEGYTHTLTGNDNDSPVVLAATWTATDTTLDVALVGTSHDNGPHFSGYVLQSLTAVPEPGSLLAIGCLIGSGALLRSRRR